MRGYFIADTDSSPSATLLLVCITAEPSIRTAFLIRTVYVLFRASSPHWPHCLDVWCRAVLQSATSLKPAQAATIKPCEPPSASLLPAAAATLTLQYRYAHVQSAAKHWVLIQGRPGTRFAVTGMPSVRQHHTPWNCAWSSLCTQPSLHARAHAHLLLLGGSRGAGRAQAALTRFGS